MLSKPMNQTNESIANGAKPTENQTLQLYAMLGGFWFAVCIVLITCFHSTLLAVYMQPESQHIYNIWNTEEETNPNISETSPDALCG